jgi:TolA-binding protein
MTRASCERAWQAAALADGRLSVADGASFERHAATCSACIEERSVLAELERAAAELPIAEVAPLARRRAKNELLRRANEQMMRGRVSWTAKAAGVAVGGLIAAAIVWWMVVPVVVRDFELATSAGAKWRTFERGASARMKLEHGRFELEVDKIRAGERFVVELPDGELEVKGTRFVVEVDRTRTERVRVEEGLVELRIQGRGVVSLRAGESWPGDVAVEQPRAAVDSGVPSRAARSPRVKVAANAGEKVVAGEKITVSATIALDPKPKEDASAGALKRSAGADFKRAMDAFTAGSYPLAEQRFAEFSRDHAEDARVEDAAFLSAVARARRGDVQGARLLAREYLRRYPRGLRRHDAERLAGEYFPK